MEDDDFDALFDEAGIGLDDADTGETGGGEPQVSADEMAPDRDSWRAKPVEGQYTPSLSAPDMPSPLDMMYRDATGESRSYRPGDEAADLEQSAGLVRMGETPGQVAGGDLVNAALSAAGGAMENTFGLGDTITYSPATRGLTGGVADEAAGARGVFGEEGRPPELRAAQQQYPYADIAGNIGTGVGAARLASSAIKGSQLAQNASRALMKTAPGVHGFMSSSPAAYLFGIGAAGAEEGTRKLVEENIAQVDSNANPLMAMAGSGALGAVGHGAKAAQKYVSNMPQVKRLEDVGGGVSKWMRGILPGRTIEAVEGLRKMDIEDKNSALAKSQSVADYYLSEAAGEMSRSTVAAEAASKAARAAGLDDAATNLYEAAARRSDGIASSMDAIAKSEKGLGSQLIDIRPYEDALEDVLQTLRPGKDTQPFMQVSSIARLKNALKSLKKNSQITVAEARAMLGGLDALAGEMEISSGVKGPFKHVAGGLRDAINAIPEIRQNNAKYEQLYKERDRLNDLFGLTGDAKFTKAVDPSKASGVDTINATLSRTKSNKAAREQVDELLGGPGASEELLSPDLAFKRRARDLGLPVKELEGYSEDALVSRVNKRLQDTDAPKMAAVRKAFGGQQFQTPVGAADVEHMQKVLSAMKAADELSIGQPRFFVNSSGNATANLSAGRAARAALVRMYGPLGAVTPLASTAAAREFTQAEEEP